MKLLLLLAAGMALVSSEESEAKAEKLDGKAGFLYKDPFPNPPHAPAFFGAQVNTFPQPEHKQLPEPQHPEEPAAYPRPIYDASSQIAYPVKHVEKHPAPPPYAPRPLYKPTPPHHPVTEEIASGHEPEHAPPPPPAAFPHNEHGEPDFSHYYHHGPAYSIEKPHHKPAPHPEPHHPETPRVYPKHPAEEIVKHVEHTLNSKIPSFSPYGTTYGFKPYDYVSKPWTGRPAHVPHGGRFGSDQYGGFSCHGLEPAFYGDSTYNCKVFHICQEDGRTDTLRCPKWTRFNQYLGVCDWWFKIDDSCNPHKYYAHFYAPHEVHGKKH